MAILEAFKLFTEAGLRDMSSGDILKKQFWANTIGFDAWEVGKQVVNWLRNLPLRIKAIGGEIRAVGILDVMSEWFSSTPDITSSGSLVVSSQNPQGANFRVPVFGSRAVKALRTGFLGRNLRKFGDMANDYRVMAFELTGDTQMLEGATSKGRDFAAAHMSLEGGIRVNKRAFSGLQDYSALAPNADFVGAPRGTQLKFTIPGKQFHSEYKILNELFEQTSAASKGKLTLYTEYKHCQSCLETLKDFSKKRPNIEIDVMYHHGSSSSAAGYRVQSPAT